MFYAIRMNAISDFEAFWIGTGWSEQGSSEHSTTEFSSTFMKYYTHQGTRYNEEWRIWNRVKEIRVPLSEECARKKMKKKQEAPQTYRLDRSAGRDELFKLWLPRICKVKLIKTDRPFFMDLSWKCSAKERISSYKHKSILLKFVFVFPLLLFVPCNRY